MPENRSYHSQIARERTLQLREIETALPAMCGDFFRAIEPRTSLLTRLNYAYDLRLFFSYLQASEEGRFPSPAAQWTDERMGSVTQTDIERFLAYLNLYTDEDGRTRENRNAGKARKLSSLKSFFKYLYRSNRIPENVLEKIEMPKVHEKEIIRLEPDEVANLLDAVESGAELSEGQAKYHRFTKTRDVALLTLLLGTGIRISELVGLDVAHIDFATNSFLVTRKGGARVVLYFGSEVSLALLKYIEERKAVIPQNGHEAALFLSLQKRRLTQRAIQMLVKKYAAIVTPLKRISPHKFRSTFGTMLNRETGDIYLVADVLGNKDVNTTRRHYAAIEDQRRRDAARVIKLRDD
jgi:site-specific recombinase XerD